MPTITKTIEKVLVAVELTDSGDDVEIRTGGIDGRTVTITPYQARELAMELVKLATEAEAYVAERARIAEEDAR